MDVATDERARQRPQELIRSIGADLALLIRQQVALAKEEAREIAAAKAMGGGLLAAAVVLGLFVVGFVGLAGAAALDLVLPRWAALLIVGAIYLVLAVIAAAVGRRALAAPTTPDRTKQMVKEDVEWARRKLQR
ncbi:MAG TPA: phage holin family protein [Actinomycetota bacterium]|nr:phage holin family protein [Actinomycetota bacterium]